MKRCNRREEQGSLYWLTYSRCQGSKRGRRYNTRLALALYTSGNGVLHQALQILRRLRARLRSCTTLKIHPLCVEAHSPASFARFCDWQSKGFQKENLANEIASHTHHTMCTAALAQSKVVLPSSKRLTFQHLFAVEAEVAP